MLINPADWPCLVDRPMAAWLGWLSSDFNNLKWIINLYGRRPMVIREALHESPMRLIDRWISKGWCVIDLGTDQPIVLYKLTCGSSVGPIDRWSFTRQRVVRMWDRSTDGPLKANAWFIHMVDWPMVPCEETCNSSVGSIDRWSLLG